MSAANARSGEIVPGVAVAVVHEVALAANTPKAQLSVRNAVNAVSVVAGAVAAAGDVVVAGIAAAAKGIASGPPRSLLVPRCLRRPRLLLPRMLPPRLRKRRRRLMRPASPSGRG
ncbi:MAG TPA: hypothetical protein VN674_08355 [Gemmatimonadales bacterium]|nr:hypothetical protein [Gemmatimonadales bacterium]